jgi:hypothetical protein
MGIWSKTIAWFRADLAEVDTKLVRYWHSMEVLAAEALPVPDPIPDIPNSPSVPVALGVLPTPILTPKEPFMSDLTSLAKGEITIPAFVTKVVGELSVSPVLKSAAGIILLLLEPALSKALGSSAVATSIISDIEAGLSGSSVSSTLSGIGI